MNGDISIAFFGTSKFSVTILDYLKEAGFMPDIIVTVPDKPQGRKMIIAPPDTKKWAVENNIALIQPETLKDVPKELKEKEWDLFIVASYGKIIPEDILKIPEHKTLNVHPSLLPKFRGASPVQSTILADEKETGVTIMLVDEKMDHGAIVAQASVSVEDWPPKAGLLKDLLANVGGELLVETIIPWMNGEINEEEQNHDDATYVKKIMKEDGLVDLNDDSYKNFLKIQAFDTWPGTYFFLEHNNKKIRIKIIEAEFLNNKLNIKRVIPEGKKEMDYQDFLRGLK